MPSPEATAVVPLDVSPSIKLISAAVEVTPSRMFNSSGVEVTCVLLAAASTGTVPDTLGKVIVLSAVASTTVSVVSWASAVAPSNITALLALIVTESTVLNVPDTEMLVAESVPVLGLYFKSPSDSKPMLPPSKSPPEVKTIALFSLVDSLSVIVTVVATAAVPEYPLDVIVPSDAPPSAKVTVPPSASIVTLPATSISKLPELRAIVVPSILKLSMSMPASAVILPADTIVPELVKLPTTSTNVA